jgi:hypothetical protein
MKKTWDTKDFYIYSDDLHTTTTTTTTTTFEDYFQIDVNTGTILFHI